MGQSIIRNEDFKTGSTIQNIKGIFYRDDGYPTGRISSPNIGALYIDNLSGQLWICMEANSTSGTSWKPFNAQLINNIRIDSDVQDGDLVGIFGAGTWATSGNLNASKNSMAGLGSQNAGLITGGADNNNGTISITETFNGSTWTVSGNLSASKNSLAGAGSLNAAFVAGGTIVATQIVTELFNGSAWSASGNLTASKTSEGAAGSLNAGIVTGGIPSSSSISNTELFNGSTWAASANMNISRATHAGFGAQNSSVVTGGTNVNTLNSTELFNGSAWSQGAVLSISKKILTGGGYQLAAFISGGQSGAGSNQITSELFNGSSWSLSGNISASKASYASGGMQNLGFIAGGAIGAANQNVSELHSQSTYRKLNFSSIQTAQNIGMASNVNTTSLTASMMTGDVGSLRIPYKTHFGISRFNNDYPSVFIASLSPTVNSIAVSISGQATLNLSTTLTNAFWNGMCLLTSGGTSYPVVGGTDIAPIVRWENASNSASPGFTVSPVYGHRFENLQTPGITLSAGSLSMSLTSNMNLTATSFARWVRVGDVLHIPHSTTSGTNGSALNYGTYIINSVSGFTVSVTSQNTAAATESLTVGRIRILQHASNKTICLSESDVKLGYNGKMHNPYFAFMDDASNGRM